LQDTLKSRYKVLNIDLDIRKRSFEKEIADNSYQPWSMDSISRHSANKGLYFSLGSWFRIRDIKYGQDLIDCSLIGMVYSHVSMKFDVLSVLKWKTSSLIVFLKYVLFWILFVENDFSIHEMG
jgi:hypothetical protein